MTTPKFHYQRDARIAWRRGQWASVDAFLRGEARKRAVGPGMAEPNDLETYVGNTGSDTGHVPERPSLEDLDKRQK